MQNPETLVRTAGARCCICKEDIDFEIGPDNVAINPAGFDPCGLGFVTNVFGPRSEQKEQWFYCHAECFRKSAADGADIGILEPDMSAIGECDEEILREILDAADATLEAL